MGNGKEENKKRLQKVQAIAKELKAKDPNLKHTEAVSLACKQMREEKNQLIKSKPVSIFLFGPSRIVGNCG